MHHHPLELELPQTEIGKVLAHKPEQSGFIYDVEIGTEFDHLGRTSPKQSLKTLEQAVADSFPPNFRYESQLALYAPEARKFITAFSTQEKIGNPVFHFAHVAQRNDKAGSNLLVGKWHNRAGIYLNKQGHNLVPAAALMILGEDELSVLFPFLDPEKNVEEALELFYLSQFDGETCIPHQTDFRHCKLDTCSAPPSGVQPQESLVHTAEAWQEGASGMVFLRDLSDALDKPESDAPKLFLLGAIGLGAQNLILSRQFQIAFATAQADVKKKLVGMTEGERLLMFQEIENNLGSALEGSKHESLMWAHEVLWNNEMRGRHELPLLNLASTVFGEPR